MEKQKPQYVVYIDEAGDPGIKQKAPNALSGASEWFLVSAVVVRSSREPDVVDWVRDMREAVRVQSRAPLHFRKLSPTNQARICRMLSTKRVRIFTVASHKTNMRGYQNKRMGTRLGRGEFYNWCLRLLLERVTNWCADRSRFERGTVELAQVVFSERGGHDYQHLGGYIDTLCMQAVHGTTWLKAKEIVAGVLDPAHCLVKPHASLAGLQLADIAASSFFQAADHSSSSFTLDNALTLKRVVPKAPKQKSAAGFGLLKLPFAH